ncbi:putative membrane protein [Sphingomonas vulcanisoli]|uniref:Membrane protein n=1 Tax=Sphingomonas vulcanisoli TaxID=1658060 RepID=A0ABX0TPT6_9SPHN|nr:hypothetical protein [Sphingomonas vulcanisoli]NIJ07552.1 putative membrane protein [Sphingomonas vulcanisoli]
MQIKPSDAAHAAAAIKAAEARTDGEVQAFVAAASDSYAEVPLHYALLVALLPLALSAAFPIVLERAARLVHPGWEEPSQRFLLTVLLVVTALVFLAGRYLFGLQAVRMALTPAATKHRRVHRRALMLFRAAIEQRTASTTGVLLYLSLAEHRAEIVADAAIHSRVDDSEWGEAMAVLLTHVKDDRPGDGIAAAIEKIGDVLEAHLPRTGTDPNELPDRLILL